jgi:hypothetical protein
VYYICALLFCLRRAASKKAAATTQAAFAQNSLTVGDYQH